LIIGDIRGDELPPFKGFTAGFEFAPGLQPNVLTRSQGVDGKTDRHHDGNEKKDPPPDMPPM
jgi:hypothetical protein